MMTGLRTRMNNLQPTHSLCDRSETNLNYRLFELSRRFRMTPIWKCALNPASCQRANHSFRIPNLERDHHGIVMGVRMPTVQGSDTGW